jgi:hypothetical protein
LKVETKEPEYLSTHSNPLSDAKLQEHVDLRLSAYLHLPSSLRNEPAPMLLGRMERQKE